MLAYALVFTAACTAPVVDSDSAMTIPQPAVCKDYLDCAAAIGDEAFATLVQSYGPGGECWSGGQDTADACATACRVSVEGIARDYPTEPACSSYAPDEPPLAEGAWTIITSDRECGAGQSLRHGTVVAGDPGEFTWVGTDFNDLACTYASEVFACSSASGRFTLDGRGAVDSATGSFTSDLGSCVAEGNFVADLDD